MQLGCHCDLWGAGRHREAIGIIYLSFLIQVWSPSHLQYNGTSWLQLQDPRGIEDLKDWVWVIGEVGFVEDQQGLHVVKNEAKLLWTLGKLRLVTGVNSQCWSLAGHLCAVLHLAVLEKETHHKDSLWKIPQLLLVGRYLPVKC